ncbi:hypothetical protein ACLOJK_027118, partial [Asimina triloba]
SIVVQRLILQLGSRPPKSSRSASPNQHPRCRTWTQSATTPITSSAAGGKQSPHRSKQKSDRCGSGPIQSAIQAARLSSP